MCSFAMVRPATMRSGALWGAPIPPWMKPAFNKPNPLAMRWVTFPWEACMHPPCGAPNKPPLLWEPPQPWRESKSSTKGCWKERSLKRWGRSWPRSSMPGPGTPRAFASPVGRPWMSARIEPGQPCRGWCGPMSPAPLWCSCPTRWCSPWCSFGRLGCPFATGVCSNGRTQPWTCWDTPRRHPHRARAQPDGAPVTYSSELTASSRILSPGTE